jgi:hypothetical protein
MVITAAKSGEKAATISGERILTASPFVIHVILEKIALRIAARVCIIDLDGEVPSVFVLPRNRVNLSEFPINRYRLPP